ncbi:MAG: aminomethyltransferase family protein [Acidobacteria bacterium]|nr:aminomethyltransferase family protein [Acidobacteriota bacterium]
MSEALESPTLEGTTVQQSPLEAAHLRAGATLRVQDGWRVPAHYGDASAEYEAVRGGECAGLFDLCSRGRVEVSGAEAVQFLNGLITNDVKTLADSAWMHAAFPNVQGRLLASVRVIRRGDAFLFDTEAATHAAVFKNLERFTMAGDFRVRDLTAEAALLSVQGARAGDSVRAILGESAANVARGRVLSVPFQGVEVTLIRATHTAEDGFDLFVAASGAEALFEAFAETDARPCGFDALEILRIETGVPRYGVDVSDANVVLEAVREDEAVSYTKGCYTGQEIIARIHWRGHVAKQLAGLVFDQDAEAPAGSIVRSVDGAREIGRITSSAYSPRLRRNIALAIVKYDFLKPGTEVKIFNDDVELCAAQVAELPLVRGGWSESAPAVHGGGKEADA